MPLQIIRQDITKMHVDAIVNTTNEEMLGYSGIDLALHTLAGAAFDEECRSLAPLALGDAKLTGGYALPAKKVIHTAAPVWRGGNFQEAEILRSCYLACLHLAAKSGCKTVAFPLIGTGNYGFPRELVLTLATNAVKEFLIENEMTVFLCVFDRNSYDIGQARFRDIQAFIDDAYEKTHGDEFYASLSMDCPEPSSAPRRAARPSRSSFTNREKSLNDILRQKDKSFAEKLFCFIDARGLTDV